MFVPLRMDTKSLCEKKQRKYSSGRKNYLFKNIKYSNARDFQGK